MIYLIFDTNIWIYLAEGQHPYVLNGILEKVKSGEIKILINEEIVSFCIIFDAIFKSTSPLNRNEYRLPSYAKINNKTK